MDRQVDTIELVERARRGDEQSLNRLAEIARERLRVYVYRLTLQEDLSQEIVQESLLEMCKVLGKLKSTDRFWPWLYGIATNKLHRHYRSERARKNATASEERRRGPMRERVGGLENLVGQELKQIVSTAMQKLRTRHKAVLVMRCYDCMSYAEIADSMGCSEFSTRMLFLRAKRALQKELSHNGFGKGSLLAALVIFGKMTAPSEAVAAQLTVPAAATQVGLLAGLVGLATTKTAIVSIAAAGALTVGTMVTMPPSQGDANVPGPLAGNAAPIASPVGVWNDAGESAWYYFPDGPDGPVMLRSTDGASRRVLQNGLENLIYQDGAVYRNNHRMWLDDLSVAKLPTDSVELRRFLARVEGAPSNMKRVTASGKGLLMVVERDEATEQGSRPWAVRHYNVLDEDYFQSDWPAGVKIVDNRDAMHTRGWTYMRVRGQITGQEVTGAGRVPFVFAACQQHAPWLRMNIGRTVTLVENGSTAVMQDAEGSVLAKYAKGTFFKGLARPWMGLHAIDTIRRDAAEQRLVFETRRMDNGRDVQVTVNQGPTQLVYTIDLEADLVTRIAFLQAGAEVGYLAFEYLQDIPGDLREFAVPASGDYRMSTRTDQGMQWLVRLAQGAFAD